MKNKIQSGILRNINFTGSEITHSMWNTYHCCEHCCETTSNISKQTYITLRFEFYIKWPKIISNFNEKMFPLVNYFESCCSLHVYKTESCGYSHKNKVIQRFLKDTIIIWKTHFKNINNPKPPIHIEKNYFVCVFTRLTHKNIITVITRYPIDDNFCYTFFNSNLCHCIRKYLLLLYSSWCIILQNIISLPKAN